MDPYPLLRWLEAQGATFVKLSKGKKTPFEKNWQVSPRTLSDILPHIEAGGNLGLLCGAPSKGIVALDLDQNFPAFLTAFPDLADAPRIIRADAPERGKVLVKIVGTIPAPKKWKPAPTEPPVAEFLSTGNQALVPPSIHPGGTPFQLINTDLPIPEIPASELDQYWREWTEESLLEPIPIAPRPTAPRTLQEAKADIKQRFDMVRYACQTLNAHAKTEGDQVRILGQGGLIIHPHKGIWTTFASEKTGGDCFALVAYLTYGKTTVKGDEWRNVLSIASEVAGVPLPEKPPPALSDNHPNATPPSPPLHPSINEDAWTGATRQTELLPSEPPRIYSIADMWAAQAGLQKAWGGWMLMNNITMIGGVSNVGKSPLLLALVAAYLKGTWCDGSPVPDEIQGRNVVYCLPEGFTEQTELLKAWGFEESFLAHRVFIPAVPSPSGPNYTFKIDTDQGRSVLEYYCEQVNPALVVIDGLRAAMSGEESSSNDCDKFMAPLVSLANRHHCAVLITHHLTKGKESASHNGEMPTNDWFRGSGHLLAACRSAWVVDQPDPTNTAKRRITLTKAAAGERGQQMAYEMMDPVDGIKFTKSIPIPPPKSKKETARRFILQVLRRDKATHEELYQLCQDDNLDISEATFRDARVELSKEKQIIQIVVGKTYYWGLPFIDYEPDEPAADVVEF